MNRFTIAAAAFTILGLMAGTYGLKQTVKQRTAEMHEIERQIEIERETIHVLRAEVTLLSDPARLESLAGRHLELGPPETLQFASLSELPFKMTDGDQAGEFVVLGDADAAIPRPHARPYRPRAKSFNSALASLDRKTRRNARLASSYASDFDALPVVNAALGEGEVPGGGY
mgnify:CR=1 FL=1